MEYTFYSALNKFVSIDSYEYGGALKCLGIINKNSKHTSYFSKVLTDGSFVKATAVNTKAASVITLSKYKNDETVYNYTIILNHDYGSWKVLNGATEVFSYTVPRNKDGITEKYDSVNFQIKLEVTNGNVSLVLVPAFQAEEFKVNILHSVIYKAMQGIVDNDVLDQFLAHYGIGNTHKNTSDNDLRETTIEMEKALLCCKMVDKSDANNILKSVINGTDNELLNDLENLENLIIDQILNLKRSFVSDPRSVIKYILSISDDSSSYTYSAKMLLINAYERNMLVRKDKLAIEAIMVARLLN